LPLVFQLLPLLLLETIKVLVMPRQGSDIPSDKVDSRAVYSIVCKSIARDAFVYEQPVLFECLVL
jgi:hypothetical protein